MKMSIIAWLAVGLVAGFIGRSMGWYANGQVPGIFASIIGAMLLLLIYRMFRGGRHLPAA